LTDWIIYGGGGHARVIADAIKLTGDNVIAYFDDNPSLSSINDVPVFSYNENIAPHAKIIIAIGNNQLRKDVANNIAHQFGTLIHPRATVADDVVIGEASVVLAGSVIQSGAIIGKHVVVNANVTIGHDVVLDDFVSIYPNAYIGGGAKVGIGATIAACSAVERLLEIPAEFTNDAVMELDLY